MDREYITESGFSDAGNGSYYKMAGDICVMLQTEKDKYNIKAYCCPTFQGLDSEVDLYIRTHVRDINLLLGSGYVSGEVLLEFPEEANGKISEYLPSSLEFIDKLIKKYDMLPACLICHRTSVLSMFEKEDGSLIPVCDVCRGEQELLAKHQRIIKNSFDPNSLVYKHPILDRGPLDTALIAGIKGGLLGSLVAVIFAILSIVLRIFALLPWIPGAVAGAYTMSVLVKIDYRADRLRTLIGSITSIATMFIISIINVFIVSGIIPLGFDARSFFSFSGVASGGGWGIVQIAVGLAGFFLSEAVVYFLNAD